MTLGANQPRGRLLVGNGFPPYPYGPLDARVIADQIVLCPSCRVVRVLRELRTMTGGLCWRCGQQDLYHAWRTITQPERS